MTEYRIDILTASGVKQAEIDNYISLGYHNEVNSPGIAEFALSGTNTKLPYLVENAQIEIYRKNDRLGLSWTRDFVGFLKKEKRGTLRGESLYVGTAIDAKYLLGTRINAYKAETTNRSSFTSVVVESVMKTIVSYNCASLATTANGRTRTGSITGLVIASNLGRGSSITWKNAFVNILEDLQELASTYAMDFNVNKTGANSWQFEVYPTQLGTDRTSTILFSLENGNMSNPEYSYNALDEKTVAIIAGDGEGIARQTTVVTSAGYSANNDYETFVDARNSKGVTALLTAKGTSTLQDKIPIEKFTFKVLQTPACYYGLHYFLGDKVKSRYNSTNFTQKIQGISVSYERKSALEDIKVKMVTL